MRTLAIGLVLCGAACGMPPPLENDAGITEDDAGVFDAGVPDAGDPWADRVTTFTPGPGAGFGQDRFPDIVLGPPKGGGSSMGSLDVLSLGKGGVIELELTDFVVFDGPGVDLLVFENGFEGFFETGIVAVSADGIEWKGFPCDATGTLSGCAGVHPVFANSEQGISSTDPAVAGGDGFDLADVGLSTARFVRVTDSGANRFYGAPGGGFDLDAIAVVNARKL